MAGPPRAPAGDRPRQITDGETQIASLLGDDAEPVERFGMSGFGGKDLVVTLFRQGDVTGAVMPNGTGKCLGNSHVHNDCQGSG